MEYIVVDVNGLVNKKKKKNLEILIEFTFLTIELMPMWRVKTFNVQFEIHNLYSLYKRGLNSRKWKVTENKIELVLLQYIEYFRVVAARLQTDFLFFESAGRWTADYVQVHESGLEKPAVLSCFFVHWITVHHGRGIVKCVKHFL